jgi:uncharacterized protein YndB with AHSA1/START domain
MRLAAQKIQPIQKTRQVPIPRERAFELFTAELGSWWPLATHSVAEHDATGVRFEGWIGGRVVELTKFGDEYVWAEVIAWDPPFRFALSWHPNPQAEAASILDVRFEATADGTTVQLEHHGWEEFGAVKGQELRGDYDSGWEETLTIFEKYCRRL